MTTEPPLDRSLFPVTERFAYLNHATICAPPTPAIEAAEELLRDASTTGGVGFLDRVASVRTVRSRLADLLGGDADGLAFTKNTTEALATIAHGLDWRPGDRVVLVAHDFPSTRQPFLALRRNGVEVVEVEAADDAHRVPMESFAAALGSGRVRMVVTSWVQSNRGWRVDTAELADLCHRHDALLCLDAIQGLGVIPMDAASWQADAVATGSHKWLLAPEGIGALWLGPRLREDVAELAPGWRWMAHEPSEAAYTAPVERAASRLEGGTLNATGLAALGAAVELVTSAGVDPIWRHVSGLLDHLTEGLAELGATVVSDRTDAGRSAIVSFVPPAGDAASLTAHLQAGGIAVSARTGAVRVSPHGFNTTEEIDALLAAVARHP